MSVMEHLDRFDLDGIIQPATQSTEAVPALRANQEVDPSGLDPHAPGAKLDAGKHQAAELLGQFSRALRAIVEVGQFGANKYTLGGWQAVPNGLKRYENAQIRHWLTRMKGESIDPDSGLLHQAHEAWNALAALELAIREMETKQPGEQEH